MQTLSEIIQHACGCRPTTAKKIVDACPTRAFASLTDGQLKQLGCAPAQVKRFMAAARLGTTVHESHARYMPETRRPDDVVRDLRARFDIGNLEQEHFWVIALNARQRVLEVFTVAIGTLSSVEVHPRELFRPLVRMAAHSCILAHNHPSEDPTPSAADVDLTERLADVGKLMGIPVLDHLVVARDSHVSLASLGLVLRS